MAERRKTTETFNILLARKRKKDESEKSFLCSVAKSMP